MKTAIIIGIGLALFSLGGYWVWGFNFNERGYTALGAYLLTGVCLVTPATFHLLNKNLTQYETQITKNP